MFEEVAGLLCRCDSVALVMSWTSVTQSNGRHMCSGSHGGGRAMGSFSAAAGVAAMRVKAAGFLSFVCLTSLMSALFTY